MPIVVTKTPESNATATYYVSTLAGPRIARRRVARGDAIDLTEYQARALVASGALVSDKALIDDPWGAEAAAAADKAATTADAPPVKTPDIKGADTKAAAKTAAGGATV